MKCSPPYLDSGDVEQALADDVLAAHTAFTIAEA